MYCLVVHLMDFHLPGMYQHLCNKILFYAYREISRVVKSPDAALMTSDSIIIIVLLFSGSHSLSTVRYYPTLLSIHLWFSVVTFNFADYNTVVYIRLNYNNNVAMPCLLNMQIAICILYAWIGYVSSRKPFRSKTRLEWQTRNNNKCFTVLPVTVHWKYYGSLCVRLTKTSAYIISISGDLIDIPQDKTTYMAVLVSILERQSLCKLYWL